MIRKIKLKKMLDSIPEQKLGKNEVAIIDTHGKLVGVNNVKYNKHRRVIRERVRLKDRKSR